ncbi:hypothetical protein BM1_03362 [Bipolaris maydis]|nr:hypothetical protein BM1_03362 [Bipolaris maydis]
MFITCPLGSDKNSSLTCHPPGPFSGNFGSARGLPIFRLFRFRESMSDVSGEASSFPASPMPRKNMLISGDYRKIFRISNNEPLIGRKPTPQH